jgi:uncharacterized protein YbaR (Trm112 family)
MSAKPIPPVQFDTSVVAQLACPACYGSLRHENSHLICASCGHSYPIIDRIPMLIVDRAESPDESAAKE